MPECKLCGSPTILLGTKRGKITDRLFHLRRCLNCQFAFVADPWTDYQAIYSEDYYRGLGADPYVDFGFESEHPETTIRVYEWRGILTNIQKLTSIRPETRWLDFGCGQGGLLQYCSRRVKAQYFGFEEGWVQGEPSGFTLLRTPDLLDGAGRFDIITAIEVFEHIENPLETLAWIRKLLKNGGVLFLTTGNPQPHWRRFLEWEYVYPEIHISYFEPATMQLLLTRAGFRPEFRRFLPGYSGILRYKILKRLGLREQRFWEKVLPWPLISRAVDLHLKLSYQPIAWT